MNTDIRYTMSVSEIKNINTSADVLIFYINYLRTSKTADIGSIWPTMFPFFT